ncbi:MAG TPA: hypothetical protein DD383_04070 [Rikenellaceae bacterium]|nr:hypothetical protein [Rikenellaceae bacterium]
MTDFKEYIRNNPYLLNDKDLPEGHEARFGGKLDAMLASAGMEQTDKVKKRKRIFTKIFTVVASAAAACAAAVIFINRTAGETEWFEGVGNDPVEVYLAYSEKASVMYGEIFTKDLNADWESTVRSIAEESVPMIDQLPDELDNAEKAIILKEYYGELLNGLDKINKIK